MSMIRWARTAPAAGASRERTAPAAGASRKRTALAAAAIRPGLYDMAPAMPSAAPGPPTVFFDGVCGLCNAWVDFLLRADRRGSLRFAALQGETARSRLPIAQRTGLETVVLLDQRGIATRSEAVLRILEALGNPWRTPAALARRIPLRWRDGLYDAVAARRYRWFGKRDACRVPSPEEPGRFLP